MKKLCVYLKIALCIGLFNQSTSYAQYIHKVDSLMKIMHNAPNDSVRFDVYRQLSEEAKNVNILQALKFGLSEHKYANLTGSKKLMQVANANLGQIYRISGDNKNALIFLTRAVELARENKDELTLGKSLYNIANLFADANRHDQAIGNYKLAIDIYKKHNNENLSFNALMSIAESYYLQDSIKIYRTYFNKAIAMAKKTKNETWIADCEEMLGLEYLDAKKFKEGLLHLQNAQVYAEKKNDTEMLAFLYANIGDCYFGINNVEMSKKYYYKCYLLSKQTAFIVPARNACERLAKFSYQLKNYFNAFRYLEEFILLKDSIKSQSVSLELSDIKNGFNRELQQAELKAEKLKEQEANEEQMRNNIIFGIVGAFLIFAVYGIFSRYRFKVKSSNRLSVVNESLNKQNEEIALRRDEIEKQKLILDATNKDITESIIYSKHLQDAILPEANFIKKTFSKSFVLFKPKDIVSGDFYWIDFDKDGNKFIAVADCTGHGVPGAFMSIVNYNLLKHAIHEHQKNTPAEILNQVNKDLSDTLRQTYNESTVRDGMDVSLVKINGRKITFAGANNSIYIKRSKENYLEEVNADKQPIGNYVGETRTTFTNIEFELEPGDIIYLYTDGYADQFGGPKGKKFKYKPLEEMLLKNSSLDMSKQLEILDAKFEDWKGLLEQIDDVTIIGITIE